MRVEQIISEKSDVNEAPAGMIRQMGRKIGSRALAQVGAKGAAMKMAGKADAGDTANDLYNQLNSYIGQTGKDMNALDAADLTKWLKSKGAPTSPVQGVSGKLTKKQVNDILMKVAQKSFEVGGDDDSAAQAPAAGAVPAQPATSKAGNQQPAAPAQAAAATKEIPADIKSEIEQLNPAQKKQLLGMLS